MNEEEFEKMVEKLGYEYEFFDKFDIELKGYPIWFSWKEDAEEFCVYGSFGLDNLRENFEEAVGSKTEEWTPKIGKLWDKLVNKIIEEIPYPEVDTDGEFIHISTYFKKFKAEKIKKEIEKLKEIIKKWEDKFTDWRIIYDYLTHEEIRNAILSKLTFMIPCEIKPIGGSYQVIIPVEGLRLIVDENVLKEKKKIKARLTIDPSNKEIKINSIE